jgi:hypothetical protein
MARRSNSDSRFAPRTVEAHYSRIILDTRASDQPQRESVLHHNCWCVSLREGSATLSDRLLSLRWISSRAAPLTSSSRQLGTYALHRARAKAAHELESRKVRPGQPAVRTPLTRNRSPTTVGSRIFAVALRAGGMDLNVGGFTLGERGHDTQPAKPTPSLVLSTSLGKPPFDQHLGNGDLHSVSLSLSPGSRLYRE